MSTDAGKPDLAHMARIKAILDAIPPGTDLPHALVALEDAFVCCSMALDFGLTLERARELALGDGPCGAGFERSRR